MASVGVACDRRDPKASDEEEYLENLFDVLCSCLMQPFSRTAFFEAEGASLMYRFLLAMMLAQPPVSLPGPARNPITSVHASVYLHLLKETIELGGCQPSRFSALIALDEHFECAVQAWS